MKMALLAFLDSILDLQRMPKTTRNVVPIQGQRAKTMVSCSFYPEKLEVFPSFPFIDSLFAAQLAV